MQQSAWLRGGRGDVCAAAEECGALEECRDGPMRLRQRRWETQERVVFGSA